jgi:hypothetical protein
MKFHATNLLFIGSENAPFEEKSFIVPAGTPSFAQPHCFPPEIKRISDFCGGMKKPLAEICFCQGRTQLSAVPP